MADLKRFFKKTVSEQRNKQSASVSVPEGLWIKCPKCGEMVYREDVISSAYVCPKCGGYFRISSKRRIKMIGQGEFQRVVYRNRKQQSTGLSGLPAEDRRPERENKDG